MDFKPQHWGMSLQFQNDPPVIVEKPNWFARVFLRRKPKTYTAEQISNWMDEGQRAAEVELLESLYRDGRQ